MAMAVAKPAIAKNSTTSAMSEATSSPVSIAGVTVDAGMHSQSTGTAVTTDAAATATPA
jgi:hypothetical protein